MVIKKLPTSPNYDSRKGVQPSIITIHIGEGSKEAIIQTFLNPKTEKSSHYLVCRDGSIIQFVDESLSAWCNGIVWQPTSTLVRDAYLKGISINAMSISIEAEGYAYQEPTETYYKSVVELVKDIARRYNIPIDQEHIIPHRFIRKDKTCPGKISVGKIIADCNAPIALVAPTLNEAKIEIAPFQPPAWYSNFIYRTKATFGFASPMFGGIPRASDWMQWRKQHIHTTCDYCGVKGTLLKPLELHHCYPYHLDPSKEKDPNNVVTLCRTCHKDHGHLGSFHSFNKNIKEDIKIFTAKVKERP